MCTQQPLTHPANISLRSPSDIDNFSKLSERQILLIITGRGYATYKKDNICTQILTTQTGNCFIFELFVIIFTFKSLILFYYNQTFGENNL